MHLLSFLEASMDNIHEGINIIDLQGRIVYTNPAYRSFVGMEKLRYLLFDH
jgi:PAS domain S-box-containing protein